MDPRQLEERIARAKEAARLASIAAVARSGPPPPRPPLPFGSAPPLLARPPPPSTAFGTGYAAQTPALASQAVPEDVRRRIEHLAEFVRRNGPTFEATVLQRERDNPSFAFLHPGAPFHDLYEWHKQQALNALHHPTGQPVAPRGPVTHAPMSIAASTPVVPDAMSSLAVGAMANVCRLAKANGVPPYTPIPPEIVASAATLPPVEPGRLEIRIADFYRA